ncbi:MAG: hypothetical protein GY847_34400, partial [Proteobacteria bacterium]|nr:hypothetical protein [Pseudomonadota bacterium]
LVLLGNAKLDGCVYLIYPSGSIARANTDQRQWFTQEVDAEDTGYGGRYYRSRVDDGRVSALSSATLATGGDSGLGRSAPPGRKRRGGSIGAA